MKIEIPKQSWMQVGGDMNPGAHGAVIATADGRAIEIREIQPVIAHVGEGEAMEVGFPFWSRDAYYDLDDLNPRREEVRNAMHSFGLTDEMLLEMKPAGRAGAIAEALLSYGTGVDEGPSGWAKDVVPGRVKWWGSQRPAGWRYLSDEDAEFRRMLRENR